MSNYKENIGWFVDYDAITHKPNLTRLEKLPNKSELTNAVASDLDPLSPGNVICALCFPRPPLYTDERLEGKLEVLFGYGPTKGEPNQIAVFDGEFHENPLVTEKNFRVYHKMLIKAISKVNTTNADSLLSILRTFGSFTREYSMLAIEGDIRSFEALKLFRKDYTLPTEIEPLWITGRKIALFLFAKRMRELLKSRKFRIISEMARITPSKLEPENPWEVTFVTDSIPEPTMMGLIEEDMLSIRLPFKPESSHHLLLAAQMLLAKILEKTLKAGIKLSVAPIIRNSDIRSLPKTTAVKSLLYSCQRMSEPKSEFEEVETPPLFQPRYTISSREQLLYMKMLDDEFRPSTVRFCHNELCNREFIPEHAAQIYCSDCRKNKQSELRQQRRINQKRKTWATCQ